MHTWTLDSTSAFDSVRVRSHHASTKQIVISCDVPAHQLVLMILASCSNLRAQIPPTWTCDAICARCHHPLIELCIQAAPRRIAAQARVIIHE